jgi:hypothetical protein
MQIKQEFYQPRNLLRDPIIYSIKTKIEAITGNFTALKPNLKKRKKYDPYLRRDFLDSLHLTRLAHLDPSNGPMQTKRNDKSRKLENPKEQRPNLYREAKEITGISFSGAPNQAI